MSFSSRCWKYAPIVLVLAAITIVGCGGSNEQAQEPHAGHNHGPGEGHHDEGEEVKPAHDHSAWWCDEHGVPEEVCTRCNSTLIADFKEKQDWCGEHERPESQCFLCKPELQAKFAARYEAKYGEAPPEITDP